MFIQLNCVCRKNRFYLFKLLSNFNSVFKLYFALFYILEVFCPVKQHKLELTASLKRKAVQVLGKKLKHKMHKIYTFKAISHSNILNQFFSFLQTKIASKLNVWNEFRNLCFRKLKSCLPHSWQKAIYRSAHKTLDHSHAPTSIYWWTLDFANAFLSPGINSRAGLVSSQRAYARGLAKVIKTLSLPSRAFWEPLICDPYFSYLKQFFCLWPLPQQKHLNKATDIIMIHRLAFKPIPLYTT
jgi:hypothetical protein